MNVSTRNQRGNALFLILIAVALFAALSYAVTQSGRGGGAGVDSEKLSLAAAEFIQQSTMIKSHIQRLYWTDRVDQVRFNSSAYNASGTYYAPGTTPVPPAPITGRTIGVFNPSEGIARQHPPEVMFNTSLATPLNDFTWHMNANTPITVNGTDLGTNADDETISIDILTQAACEAINEGLTGSTAIPAFTIGGANNRRYEAIHRDGTETALNTNNNGFDVGLIPGCNTLNGGGVLYSYFEIIKAN